MLGSCVKFSQTAVVVLKNSFPNEETFAEVGRLIFRAFQCEVELDYITVSRLLLVPVAKGLWKQFKNWFQLIYPNLSWVLHCVALCINAEQIGDFCNPNRVQNFHWEILSDPNPVDLFKYLIQSGLCPKKPSD